MNRPLQTAIACLNDFLHECVASAPVEQADRLREARALFDETSAIFPGLSENLPGQAEFERLLASAAYESAAISLLGPATSFMLSRGGNGTCLATMTLAEVDEDVTAEGSTLALALLAARVSALLSTILAAVPRTDTIAPSASMRLN
ncbi:MAG: hypothetical protein KDE55_03090 [Novosphingobium sp.]|nr:hypothetical protein [Novosphingobium sp.]